MKAEIGRSFVPYCQKEASSDQTVISLSGNAAFAILITVSFVCLFLVTATAVSPSQSGNGRDGPSFVPLLRHFTVCSSGNIMNATHQGLFSFDSSGAPGKPFRPGL